MNKLLLLPLLAFGSPAEREVTVADVQLKYAAPVVAEKRPGAARDFVIYDFIFGGETILTVYFGPHARFQSPNRPKSAPLEDRYNGLLAKTLSWGLGKKRWRETIVELGEEGWAPHAHLSYQGVSADGAAQADGIIQSIQKLAQE